MENKQTVRNEQTKPDDLKKLMLDSVKNASNEQGLANRMLALAQGFCDKAGVLNVAEFTGKCSEVENWIRSDMARTHKVNKLPGNWTNTKSRILKAVKPVADGGTGKSLTEFQTMHELRKALPKGSRKARTDKKDSGVSVNLDPKIGALLATLGQQIDAMAVISLSVNQKGLDDLEADLTDCVKANAAILEHYKVNAAAYVKEGEKVTGAQKEEALDVDEELDETPDVIDEALKTQAQKPGARKH